MHSVLRDFIEYNATLMMMVIMNGKSLNRSIQCILRKYHKTTTDKFHLIYGIQLSSHGIKGLFRNVYVSESDRNKIDLILLIQPHQYCAEVTILRALYLTDSHSM